MGNSISTVLLAIGALIMVGAGAFIIATTALGGDGDDVDSSPGTEAVSEEHVYLMNLGMT